MKRHASQAWKTLSDEQVHHKWRQTRSATWRAIRVWFYASVSSAAAFAYLARTDASEMTGVQLIATFAVFLVLGTCMVAVILRTNALYRCPKCNAIPHSGWTDAGPTSFGFQSGIALNPKICSNCGTSLRQV